MQAASESASEQAQYTPLYFTALLKTHRVAQRAIWRLEMLCEQYPDPALLEALEVLRREQEGWSWRADALHAPRS